MYSHDLIHSNAMINKPKKPFQHPNGNDPSKVKCHDDSTEHPHFQHHHFHFQNSFFNTIFNTERGFPPPFSSHFSASQNLSKIQKDNRNNIVVLAIQLYVHFHLPFYVNTRYMCHIHCTPE